MQERLQKILSRCGVASRRHAEALITAGRVTVNGTVATLGQKADLHADRIEVDGKLLSASGEFLYFLMHKPAGVEVTMKTPLPNPRGEGRIVSELLPSELRGKVFPVGRLDKDSSGLLLFTNDGELAYRLTHPKFPHEKEYLVTLYEPIADGALRKLQNGVMIDGSKTKPAKTFRLAPGLFRISLTEGRYRQIRRMCQKVGSTVTALQRIRIATLQDDALRTGEVRKLNSSEIQTLLRAIDTPPSGEG